VVLPREGREGPPLEFLHLVIGRGGFVSVFMSLRDTPKHENKR
jgi:hypothetical protein